jgi:hypothetical protein
MSCIKYQLPSIEDFDPEFAEWVSERMLAIQVVILELNGSRFTTLRGFADQLLKRRDVGVIPKQKSESAA